MIEEPVFTRICDWVAQHARIPVCILQWGFTITRETTSMEHKWESTCQNFIPR